MKKGQRPKTPIIISAITGALALILSIGIAVYYKTNEAVMISIAIMIFGLLAVMIILKSTNTIQRKPIEPEDWKNMGVIFFMMGALFKMDLFMILGLVYFIIGTSKKNDKKDKLSWRRRIMVGLLAAVIAGVIAFLLIKK